MTNIMKEDLFVAGTDTVEWAMAELIHNPNIMSKAKAELAKTPLLASNIVKETFRLHPAVPLLLPRKAEVDLEMQGYTVPKGAQVLVNVWAIGRDPKLWDNSPSLFSPETFLGSEIDFIWGWKEDMPWLAIGHNNIVVLDVGFAHQFL
ncbi:hypothetical protein AAZX31_20G002800 [Glycine max]